MQLTLEVDTRKVLGMLEAYPKRAGLAVIRSLNRAGKAMHTQMARDISKDMGLKVGDVKQRIAINRASLSTVSVELGASLKRIPLIKFGARATKKGLTYRLPGGQQRHPHGFIIERWRGAFERAPGAKRGPVQQLHGPSVGRVFAKHAPKGIERATEQFKKDLAHELSRLGGGAF